MQSQKHQSNEGVENRHYQTGDTFYSRKLREGKIHQVEGANQDGRKHGTQGTGNLTQKRCKWNPEENCEEKFQGTMQDKWSTLLRGKFVAKDRATRVLFSVASCPQTGKR